MAGDFEFLDNTKNCLNAIGEDLLQNMTAAVELVKLNVLQMLSHPGTGRQYKVPGTKGAYYIASAPGEPPAVRLGDLKRSIDTDVIVEADTITGEVGTDREYGPMLEYGTMNILPRPWLRPSFEQSQAEVEDILQQPVGLEIE